MEIQDRIYGKITIKDKVIIELINTPSFRRLKKISQDGASHFIQPVRNVTRYEHSIGVWYLSSKYKRPMEEQIASLLHDLSHTAFSHVADLVVKNSKHEYADEKLKDVIFRSTVPDIISSNGYDLEKVLDKTQFPLLDNSLPDVSVDRWDYFMRDGFAIGFLPESIIKLFLSSIFLKNDIFYFRDSRLASSFAILFVNFSRLIWLDPTSHGAYFLLAKAIKLGIKDKYITESDLFTDDETLLSKLKKSSNPTILELIDRLQPGKEFIYEEKSKAEFFGPNKPRYVDPFVESSGKLIRISKLVPSLEYFFKEFVKQYKTIGVSQLRK